MLRHLHPQLGLPTLCEGAAAHAGRAQQSAAHRRYSADRAGWQQPGLLLSRKRKARGGGFTAEQVADSTPQESEPGHDKATTPAQQRCSLGAVLQAAAAILGMAAGALGASSGKPPIAGQPAQIRTLPGLLAAAARLRPWQQRCLAQQASAALPELALAASPASLLGCLALLDAAGGAADAVRALLAAVPRLLVAEALSSRTAGRGGNPTGAKPGCCIIDIIETGP
jgi:hypothetical protein